MPIAIKGSGGGSVTLDSSTAASDTTLTLPNANGTVLHSGTTVTAAQGGTGLISPGASGNVLTSNGTTWVSSALPASASLTLLATLTTTSGTTQSVTGLATTYTNLLIVCENVGDGQNYDQCYMTASTNNGSTYGATNTSYGIGATNATGLGFYGAVTIYRANASVTNRPVSYASTGTAAASINTLSAAPINALRFTWSTATAFNSGTIYIYGVN